ncbi:hypothetical protein B0H14DRAFT_2888034 [Mycena olivaceomarginata]|nr:hypothetical protein B0H14DRAFT_2888034 [Mycena olivaceomarginata]
MATIDSFSNSLHLPLELERTIFEIAALVYPKSIPSLIWWPGGSSTASTVSCHHGDQSSSKIRTASLHRWRCPTRGPGSHLHSVQPCRGLVLEVPSFLRRFEQLYCLALTFHDFLASSLSCLGSITHLELLGTGNNPSTGDLTAHLPLMPRLTHLSFDAVLRDWLLQTGLLATSNILILASAEELSQGIHHLDPFLRDDRRFLCLDQQTDWREDRLRGVATGEDYWTLADAFIAARREGRVDRCTLTDTDLSWRMYPRVDGSITSSLHVHVLGRRIANEMVEPPLEVRAQPSTGSTQE